MWTSNVFQARNDRLLWSIRRVPEAQQTRVLKQVATIKQQARRHQFRVRFLVLVNLLLHCSLSCSLSACIGCAVLGDALCQLQIHVNPYDCMCITILLLQGGTTCGEQALKAMIPKCNVTRKPLQKRLQKCSTQLSKLTKTLYKHKVCTSQALH